MTANRLCLLVAAWIVLTANGAFWALMFKMQGPGAATRLFAVSLFFALLGLNLVLLRLLTPGRSLRVMLTAVLLLAATASWFMDTYGVALDSDMLRNALQTNAAEASDFLGVSLLWRLLWQAGIPIALVWVAPLPPASWQRSTRDYVLGLAAGLVLLFASALPMYASYASYFRNNKPARYLIAPANVLVGSVRLVRKSLYVPGPFEQVGLDAKRPATPGQKPRLVLVVVGETARAANFSLGGYERDTNPGLRQRGVYYFSNVTSCGTSTAVSLPCMFSDLPREQFDLPRAAQRDSVLDILQRAGLDVAWIDNQSGCKKTCDRVPFETAAAYHPLACIDGECKDEVLLHALSAKLPSIERDTVMVLHTMGSHGPAYYRRTTPLFARFQPACGTERIENCSDEEIVNAYDNSILYTDHILSGLIDRLAAGAADVDSVLLYVSDHGESLGESGLYLHGQPWVFAPDVQKRVPMLMWFSDGAPPALELDLACLHATLDEPTSHDALAHTLLGLGDVRSVAYRAPLDLMRTCRKKSV